MVRLTFWISDSEEERAKLSPEDKFSRFAKPS